jgi:hypothetical protein
MIGLSQRLIEMPDLRSGCCGLHGQHARQLGPPGPADQGKLHRWFAGRE